MSIHANCIVHIISGGGLGRGEERTYGCAADQVLELEMILPDGQHVKFGYVKSY